MTDQELLGAARQTLNMARADWELQGWPTGIVLASYHATDVPPLRRMRLIEALLQNKLGKSWLNDDAKKDHGFYVLRLGTLALPPDAVVIVTPTNAYQTTAKFKLRGKAVSRATDTPEKRRQLVAEGQMELVDSVTATAQTPERVCGVCQPVERGVYVGEPRTHFFDQAQFSGRMKMFGGEISEHMREEIALFREVLKRRREERTL